MYGECMRANTHGVVRIRHGVEWTKSHRELVNDIVVDVVLLLDNAPELLLVLGTTQAMRYNGNTRGRGLT